MSTQPVSSKVPYSIPKLTVYGDLRLLTQTAGNKSSNADGGAPGNMDKSF